MIIKPKVRGFMCITTHPAGCDANVKRQIEYVKARGAIGGSLAAAPKRVLVIGASTGYGLASRISAAFGCGAATLGVFFEKEGTESKPGTAGWYNSAAFHKYAEAEGLPARSINGDAFSDEIKRKTIDAIAADMGQVDLVVYSLAAPRRLHPVTGAVHTSTLKPIGKDITYKSLNTDKETIGELTVPAATQEDIDNTVAVMGGEDWEMWIDALSKAGVLAEGAKTTAYTYLGDRLTWDIYWHGTIGAAKQDLDKRVIGIRQKLAAKGGDARVSVLQAVITQASSAIPAMPLYLALLLKVMKEDKAFQGCIEQIHGLFQNSLYGDSPKLDDEGRLRADSWELQPEIQARVEKMWQETTTENLRQVSDFAAYKRGFLQLFGFEVDGVDYDGDVNPLVPIPNLL